MSAFDDILADDAELLSDADAFPGVETFKLLRHGKAPVSVTGPVFRDPAELMARYNIAERGIVVFIASSLVDKIDSPGDAVEIAFDYGGTAERHGITQILKQDAGGWELLLS